MSDTNQGKFGDVSAQRGRRTLLKDEHALLLREVTTRAHAVTAEADQGRWPQPQLRELLNYLHLEILRQVVEEEWLLFRAVRHATDDLARLRHEHHGLRAAIEVLDLAAATADSSEGLSPQQLSTTTRDLLAQLEAHFAAEDRLAVVGEPAPSTASFGAQPHEWYPLTEGPVIDLDKLPGQRGADAALARLERLRSSEQIQIRSSDDPTALWQRLSMTDPGGYGIDYLERGPNNWLVEITRRPAQRR